MQSLSRNLAGVAERIKVPWANLGQSITPGPGHLVLCTGAPGVGKSAFALAWAVAMDSPALYLSLDSDLATQAARTVSMLTSVPYSQVHQNIPQWEEYLRVRDRQLPMMIDSTVKAGDVNDVAEAFGEFHSRSPSLIVVDNLKNVVESPSFEGYQEAVLDLIRAAKRQKTVVLALHHVNRSSRAGRGDVAPDLDSGKFGGEDDAPFVISLYHGWNEFSGRVLNVRINKNRFGPSGHDVPLKFDFEKMQIREA